MAAVDVIRSLQGLQRRPVSGMSLPPFVGPITGPETQSDGTELFRTSLIPSSNDDLSIPLGSWTLLLLNVDAAGTAQIPVRMFFNGPGQPNPGEFRRIEADLARFELITNPDHLVPADLVADPYIHLVPNSSLGPVRLLGPGLTVILRGEGLTDLSANFTGANGGSDERFPSARFDPPHFLIGPMDNLVGVACDEVMLDLSTEIDPENLEDLTGTPSDGTFEGLILQELGFFFGDPNEVGTWSGMMRVYNFVMRFPPHFELTGTFEGELVHAVAPDDPQIAVVVSWVTDSGQRVNVDEVDPTIPAPVAPETTRRVRLVATPNWASVGFDATWTVPNTVTVEDRTRIGKPDLGWVLVPPGAHNFSVEVKDHRVDTIAATRTVLVQAPPPPPPPHRLEVDLVATEVGSAPEQCALSLYFPLFPKQLVALKMLAKGGTGNTITAGCAVPQGWIVDGPQTQTATRMPSGEFPAITWTLTSSETPSEGSIVVGATVGTEGVERRLRYTLRERPEPGSQELDLIAQKDWLPQTGAAAAWSIARDGLPYPLVKYYLADIPAPADLLSSATQDDLFAADSPAFPPPTSETEVPLASTGQVVKPELLVADQFYRLIGEVQPGPGVRPPTVVLLPKTFPLPETIPQRGSQAGRPAIGTDPFTKVTEVKELIGSTTLPEFFSSDGSPAEPIRFKYDSDEVPPPPPFEEQHENLEETLDELKAKQAQGFADIFRAVDEYGDRIDRLGLFASASTERELKPEYNLDLSKRRLHSALDNLKNPLANVDLLAEIAKLPVEHRVDASLIERASTRIRNLESESKIVKKEWGEDNVTSGKNPFDRRVFAVIQLMPPPDTPGFSRRTYFLVRAGAPVTPPPVLPKLPKPERHPFRHAIFRSAHVELEIRRNELLRFQIRLELDLERFDENDLDPPGQLNPSDGIVTGFLELRRNPDPSASPRYAWELDLLADPTDIDGLLTFIKGGTLSPFLEIFGGPLIAMPAMAAAAGGQTGPSGLLVALAIGAFLQRERIFDVQTIVWRGFRLRLRHGGSTATRFSIALDYSVKYDIDVDLSPLGLPIRLQTTSPIEITFRNVGVEVIGSFDGAVLFYDPASGFAVDIGDPGVFLLGDGLGRLMRVDRVTMGATNKSPLWLEVELGFALDTGVFSVDTLRIRLSLEIDKVSEPDEDGVVHLDGSALDLDDLSMTINKLGVSVNFPGIIKGSGVLGIKEEAGGTTVEGGLALDFESLPVLRGLEGRMRLFTSADLRALYLALGIEFSPGLALGSTGVAIYGLHGLLGSNMAPSRPDPLEWLRQPPVGVTSETKWLAARGAWAFGAGAILGTVFDNGFALNLNGTLLLLLPGPRFVLAAHANVLSPKPDVGEVGGVLATVTLDLENNLITAGFDLTVSIDSLLRLRVPTEAFFDLTDAANFYVRFGQWVPESKRISLRLFELFDAWGYLQIEGRGLDNGALKLDGFVVATGARIEINWGAEKVLYLEAFAEVHAGIQFPKLYFEGLVIVGGRLHIGPCSIGAEGELRVKALVIPTSILVLEGKVCGTINLWLTKLKKCAHFDLGDADRPTPQPENPFIEVIAIDRATGLPIEETNGEMVVPIDAVFHATFTSDIRDQRSPPGISFAVNQAIFRNQVSDSLFYEFNLTTLALRQIGGAELNNITSVWAPYTLVEASSSPPSQRTLRVMDWKPIAHPRQVDFGSAVQSALEVLVRALCDPIVMPPRQCVDFDEEPLGHKDVWVLDHGELPPVRVIGLSSLLGAEVNFGAQLPRVVNLMDIDYPGRRPRAHCLHFGLAPPMVLDIGPTEVKNRTEKLRSEVQKMAAGGPIPNELHTLRGDYGVSIWIRLPSLVAVDAVFVVPEYTLAPNPGSGSLTLLDGEGQPLVGPILLERLPYLTDATGTFPNHAVHRLSFGDPLPSPINGNPPPTAEWLVLYPPGPLTKPGDDRMTDDNYLLELCGVTLTAWREFTRAHESVQETISQLTRLSGLVAGEPVLLDQPLLVPGARYELVGSMDWARYRSRDDANPDGSSADQGGPFPIQSRQFLADPQSPRDLTRYVRDHDPFDQDQPHYAEEPLVLRYASAAVDRIYAAYSEQLVIRAKSHSQDHVVVQPTASTAGTTFTPMGPVEEELLRSLDTVTGLCLPGIWAHLFPRSLHTVTQPLQPNSSYTVSVLARPQSEPGPLSGPEWEKVLEEAFETGAYVYRFELRTSRWSSFAQHVAAYAVAPVGDLFVDDPDALAEVVAGLPIEPLLRSDRDIDTLCVAVTGGPVLIPDQPEVMRLWVQEGSSWRCVGLLLDGPEPLLRRRLRDDGRIEERIAVDIRSTTLSTVPFELGIPLSGLHVVTGASGSRIFMLFEPQVATNHDLAVVLRLHDRGPSIQTSPGADHDLPVIIGAIPAVLLEVES